MINKIIYKLKLRKYVKKNLKSGFSVKDIKRKLKEKKVPDDLAGKILDDVIQGKLEKVFIIFLLAILIPLIFYIFYFSPLLWFQNLRPYIVPTIIIDQCNTPYSGMDSLICIEKFGLYTQDDSFNGNMFLSKDAPSCFKLNNMSESYDCYYLRFNNSNFYPCGIYAVYIDHFDHPFMLDEDIIKAVNWKRIKTLDEFYKYIGKFKPDDIITIQTTMHLYKLKVSELGPPGLYKNHFGQGYCISTT